MIIAVELKSSYVVFVANAARDGQALSRLHVPDLVDVATRVIQPPSARWIGVAVELHGYDVVVAERTTGDRQALTRFGIHEHELLRGRGRFDSATRVGYRHDRHYERRANMTMISHDTSPQPGYAQSEDHQADYEYRTQERRTCTCSRFSMWRFRCVDAWLRKRQRRVKAPIPG